MQNTNLNSLLNTPHPLLDPFLVCSRPWVARAADAMTIEFPGEKSAVVPGSARTGGHVTVGHLEAAVNGGPPPHVHANEDEIFLIRSGAFEIFINGQYLEARAGDVVYAARGDAHRFRGLDSGEPNTFHIFVTPGGFEYFFQRFAELMNQDEIPMEQIIALSGEYGITLFPSDEAAPIVENPKSKIIRVGSRPSLDVMGINVNILLDTIETQGRYSLVSVEGSKDAGVSLHIHAREDELILIESGVLEITLINQIYLASAGDVIWAPRDVPHGFCVVSDEGARAAIFITPGGFEGFFTDCDVIQQAGQMAPENLTALSGHFGLQMVPMA